MVLVIMIINFFRFWNLFVGFTSDLNQSTKVYNSQILIENQKNVGVVFLHSKPLTSVIRLFFGKIHLSKTILNMLDSEHSKRKRKHFMFSENIILKLSQFEMKICLSMHNKNIHLEAFITNLIVDNLSRIMSVMRWSFWWCTWSKTHLVTFHCSTWIISFKRTVLASMLIIQMKNYAKLNTVFIV
jgi:hypothetical protein